MDLIKFKTEVKVRFPGHNFKTPLQIFYCKAGDLEHCSCCRLISRDTGKLSFISYDIFNIEFTINIKIRAPNPSSFCGIILIFNQKIPHYNFIVFLQIFILQKYVS